MTQRVTLPVTLLSGFLGAGKTTLLGSLLRQQHGLRIGVIVNDMSALNIDADIARTTMIGGLKGHSEGPLVQLQNGCICCTLREDLVAEVARLADAGEIDHLVIESTGISEPRPVAGAFSHALPGDAQRLLSDIAKLDTLVTVVDGVQFLKMYRAAEPIQDDAAERTLSDLLVEQVEFANVLLISKTDQISPQQLGQLRGILQTLNPSARILDSVQGDVPHAELIGTGRFSAAEGPSDPGWLSAIKGDSMPKSEGFGIHSFVWQARRPLHPQRFWDFLSRPWPSGELLRSKGFVWLATRHDSIGLYQQAGGSLKLEHAGAWWATVPPDLWPINPDLRDWIDRKSEAPHGDRRQEIAFIGRCMAIDAVIAQLDACLLTPVELAAGPSRWRDLPDPFPEWPVAQPPSAPRVTVSS